MADYAKYLAPQVNITLNPPFIFQLINANLLD